MRGDYRILLKGTKAVEKEVRCFGVSEKDAKERALTCWEEEGLSGVEVAQIISGPKARLAPVPPLDEKEETPHESSS